MKYIHSRFTYFFTGVIGVIFIAVACSDTIQTDTTEPAGVKDLTQNAEFKSMINGVQQFNAPLVEKVKSMKVEEIKKFRKNLSSYIDRSGSKPKLNGDREQLFKKLGYKNSQQYEVLFQSLKDKVDKFKEVYPEAKPETIREAAKRILKPKFSKNVAGPATVSNDETYCFEEVYVPCIREALITFGFASAGCFAVGYISSPIGGAACQIVNIGAWETRKYFCIQDYRECMECRGCGPPEEIPQN